MDYQQITIPTTDQQHREILIALLDAAGYEAFEEREDALLAYIPADQYDAAALQELADGLGLRYTEQRIARQNWNEEWERHFLPVVVSGFCTVRASFHPPQTDTPYEIIITPKMSFGTGHHATTQLMIGSMRGRDMKGKRVLDFGTGTGILAILAHKLGASEITAIDTDKWCVTNAAENSMMNDAGTIDILQGSLEVVAGAGYDLILANINRHILLQYMAAMSLQLEPGGTLILSGILIEDEPVIRESAAQNGLFFESGEALNNWLSLTFTRQSG